MSGINDPARLLDREYERIRRVVLGTAYRNGFDHDEAEDLVSWCVDRLVDKDFSILRQYSGVGSLNGYLSVVLSRLAIDYRNAHWGRWRPSAAAQRLGPIAVRLERLCFRDGRTFDEAVATLLASGAATSEADLRRVYRQLPVRFRVKSVELETVAELPGGTPSDQSLNEAERDEAGSASHAELAGVLGQLDVEDQVLIQLLFWDRLSVADAARRLGLDQKPLYRRIPQILKHLRESLEARGVTRDQISALLDDGVPA